MEASERPKHQRTFLLVLATCITLLFLKMIQGYLLALLSAAVFAGLSQPVYARLLKVFRGRAAWAAGATVLLDLLLVVLPLLGFLGVLAGQAVDVSQTLVPWIQEQARGGHAFENLLAKIPGGDRLAPYQDQILEKAGEVAARAAGFVADALAAGALGTARFLLLVFVMLYAMLAFLMSGRALLDRAYAVLPLPVEDHRRMEETFRSMARAVVKGTLVVGAVQGALVGLAFAVAGIQGPVFWGTAAAVCSVIPSVGTALVWVPGAVYLLLSGHPAAAAGLTLWCGAVVGSVDNLLRPRLVGKDTRLPDLLVLLGTLGGLSLFGPIGLVLGPIVAALLVTAWDLYGTQPSPRAEETLGEAADGGGKVSGA
ncbi:MAG: AI-2E family transporter [Acidobacteriota bacterium]